MLQLLLAAAFIFFVVIAPMEKVMWVVISILLMVGVVKLCAKVVSGSSPSWGESFNAVALSCIFVVVAMLGLSGFSSGSGAFMYSGISALAALGVFFCSYVLGFSVALGTKFGPSVIIAVISTAITEGLFIVAGPII
jgi:hypothetical protein